MSSRLRAELEASWQALRLFAIPGLEESAIHEELHTVDDLRAAPR
jgi:hypothetical protein